MKKTMHSIFTLPLAIAFFGTVHMYAQGNYDLVEIPAPSLVQNIIGTATTQKIGVYTPPDYKTSLKHYPVVYFLNGYTVKAGQFPSTYILDSLMKNNIIDDIIWVELSGFNLFQGSMYANSPVTGNWEDFVVKDVVNHIDNNYRTLAKRESRGICGHSMGGAGTINISQKHADIFSVAYAMSPVVTMPDSVHTGFFNTSLQLQTLKKLSDRMEGVSNEEFAPELTKAIQEIAPNDVMGINWTLAYGSAYVPDLSQPLRIAFPYDFTKDDYSVRNDSIWQLWEQGFGNVAGKVKKYADNLNRYKLYVLDCGYQDEVNIIAEGVPYYSMLLSQSKIPHTLEWYTGNHTSGVGIQQAKRVLPAMAVFLDRE